MLDFEEELKRFQPSKEVEKAADTIVNRDMTDMTDLLMKLLKEKEVDWAHFTGYGTHLNIR